MRVVAAAFGCIVPTPLLFSRVLTSPLPSGEKKQQQQFQFGLYQQKNKQTKKKKTIIGSVILRAP